MATITIGELTSAIGAYTLEPSSGIQAPWSTPDGVGSIGMGTPQVKVTGFDGSVKYIQLEGNDEEIAAAEKYLNDLQTAYVATPQGSAALDTFLQGQAGMVSAGPWFNMTEVPEEYQPYVSTQKQKVYRDPIFDEEGNQISPGHYEETNVLVLDPNKMQAGVAGTAAALPEGSRWLIEGEIAQAPDGTYYGPNGIPIDTTSAEARIATYQYQVATAGAPTAPTPPTEFQQWQMGLYPEQAAAEQALAQQQLALEQQLGMMPYQQMTAYQQATTDLERQQILAQMATQPKSWLEYSALAGTQPAIQPWMLPLMPQEYGQLQAGGAMPGWPYGGTTGAGVTPPTGGVPGVTPPIPPTGGVAGAGVPMTGGTPIVTGAHPSTRDEALAYYTGLGEQGVGLARYPEVAEALTNLAVANTGGQGVQQAQFNLGLAQFAAPYGGYGSPGYEQQLGAWGTQAAQGDPFSAATLQSAQNVAAAALGTPAPAATAPAPVPAAVAPATGYYAPETGPQYAQQYAQQYARYLPGYQQGGIAWQPQTARLAEREPEVITPLSQWMKGLPTEASRQWLDMLDKLRIMSGGRQQAPPRSPFGGKPPIQQPAIGQPTTQPTTQTPATTPQGGTTVGAPSPTTTNVGAWMPSVASEQYPLGGMPGIARPSRQYQARMGPTAFQQYAGYEQARTGITPQELEWRLWSMAPPSGAYRGLTYGR